MSPYQVLDLLLLFILHCTNANQSRRGAERLLKLKVRKGLIQEALLQKTFRDYSQVGQSVNTSSPAKQNYLPADLKPGNCCVYRSCEGTSPLSWLWLRVWCAPLTPVWCLLVGRCTESLSLCLTLTASRWGCYSFKASILHQKALKWSWLFSSCSGDILSQF